MDRVGFVWGSLLVTIALGALDGLQTNHMQSVLRVFIDANSRCAFRGSAALEMCSGDSALFQKCSETIGRFPGVIRPTSTVTATKKCRNLQKNKRLKWIFCAVSSNRGPLSDPYQTHDLCPVNLSKLRGIMLASELNSLSLKYIVGEFLKSAMLRPRGVLSK